MTIKRSLPMLAEASFVPYSSQRQPPWVAMTCFIQS